MASSVYLCQMCDLGCFWLPPLSTCIYYQIRTNRQWWQPSTAKVMSTPLNSAETSFSYSHVLSPSPFDLSIISCKKGSIGSSLQSAALWIVFGDVAREGQLLQTPAYTSLAIIHRQQTCVILLLHNELRSQVTYCHIFGFCSCESMCDLDVGRISRQIELAHDVLAIESICSVCGRWLVATPLQQHCW